MSPELTDAPLRRLLTGAVEGEEPTTRQRLQGSLRCWVCRAWSVEPDGTRAFHARRRDLHADPPTAVVLCPEHFAATDPDARRPRPAPSAKPTPKRKPARAPATTGRTKRGTSNLPAIRAAMREFGQAWVTQGEIADAVGTTKNGIRQSLYRLIDAGEVEARGDRATRRFRWAPDGPTADAAHAQAPAATAEPETIDEPRETRTGRQIGYDRSQIRQRIPALLHENPGALNEDRLTAALAVELPNVDREDVAVICGELLEQELVRLAGDGTYYPTPALEVTR
jgi:hypothetical protein